MVNGSFVFGMDDDGADVFERTVDWAVAQGIETATFHILTPYPGTRPLRAHGGEGRIAAPRLGPLRHPARGLPARRADRRRSWRTATGGPTRLLPLGRDPPRRRRPSRRCASRLRHVAYAGGWKKFEPIWDLVIRARQVIHVLPLLETVLAAFGRRRRRRPQRCGSARVSREQWTATAGRTAGAGPRSRAPRPSEGDR